MVQPTLFNEEMKLLCFIESFAGKIINYGIHEEPLFNFKRVFTLKYELEYGTNKSDFINIEQEKYLKQVTDQIDFEVKKENDRMKHALKDVSSKTLEYLENLSKHKNQQENEMI